MLESSNMSLRRFSLTEFPRSPALPNMSESKPDVAPKVGPESKVRFPCPLRRAVADSLATDARWQKYPPIGPRCEFLSVPRLPLDAYSLGITGRYTR